MTELPLPTTAASSCCGSIVVDDVSSSSGSCEAEAAHMVDESKESGTGDGAGKSAEASLELPGGSTTVVLSYKKRCPEYTPPCVLAVTVYLLYFQHCTM